jgi:lipopolysaccharide biosynthesis glycosyltransferase
MQHKIYIGFDPKEAVAYHVCVNSIIRQSSVAVDITPLALTTLHGYVERADRAVITDYPPTNQFSFSRFLVPYMNDYKGWALFIDGDMILLDDIKKLYDMADDRYAVMCVKHDYKTKYPIKYMGQVNLDYERKNWSSVMLINCGHPANKALTPQYVINATGKQLHRFEWLTDDLIGEIPIEWNWLPDEHGINPDAKLLHYTVGAPCFHDYATTPMSDVWHRERMLMNYSVQR